MADQPGVQSDWVEISSGDEAIQGYLARPDGPGRFPALVQVHENLGIIEHRKDVAGRLASRGYLNVTPNLFSRIGGRPPQDFATQDERRRKAFLAVPDQQAIGDILAAHRYLTGRQDVLADRIGIIGFCMGGSLALIAVCQSADFKIFVDFYGALAKPADFTEDRKELSYLPLVSRLTCPIQIHIGSEDEVISDAEVAEFEYLLMKHGKDYELHRYPGARHAFHDDTNERYSPRNAALAQERAFEFLQRHL